MTWWPGSGSCFVFAAAVGEGHEVEGIAEALLFQDVLLVVMVARGRSRSQSDGWRRGGVMTMLRQAMTALMVMARRSRPEVRNGMNLTRHGVTRQTRTTFRETGQEVVRAGNPMQAVPQPFMSIDQTSTLAWLRRSVRELPGQPWDEPTRQQIRQQARIVGRAQSMRSAPYSRSCSSPP